MKYNIIKYPTKTLLEPSIEIDFNNVNKVELATHIVRMLHTMLNTNGIGISSPQVGKNIRLVVLTNVDTDMYFKDEILVQKLLNDLTEDNVVDTLKGVNYLINPIITKSSPTKIAYTEGCLSVPNITTTKIKRPNSVIVKFNDIEGNEKEHIFNNIGSICIQHEIDHLDGKLFFMNLNQINRNKTMRSYKY